MSEAVNLPVSAAPKRKRRVFLWVFLTVQALFLVWVFWAGSLVGSPATDCEGLSRDVCQSATDVGAGIGMMLVVGLWAFVDFMLAVIYGVYRLARRT